VRGRRRERPYGRGRVPRRTHNTLSAETSRVQIFYPFHPHHGMSLRVVRRPRQGDGAVSVIDPSGHRLKIPTWMLSPAAGKLRIGEQALLSRDALVCLSELLDAQSDSPDSPHDTLQPTVVDKRRGGHRAATATSGDERGGTDRRRGSKRTGRSDGSCSDDGLRSRSKEDR
jgi:hypothetical protein